MSDDPQGWRPRFHFSAPSGWINDPNGLFRVGDTWHVQYQYLLPREWGHASSTDLLTWKPLPVALHADEHGHCWSGCTVEDPRDTSGFFGGKTDGLVSVFTSFDETKGQRISLASSADHGATWQKHSGNPILHGATSQFRDPKVFWHEPTQRWVMVLTESIVLSIYVSTDLKRWTRTAQFTPPAETDIDGYECPDLFALPVANQPGRTKWILNSSCVNGGCFSPPFGYGLLGHRYFVGEFDGETFRADRPGEHGQSLSAGPDDYAAIVWPAETSGARRTLMIGWMNHWGYAGHIPTEPWQGCLTLPRELSLHATGENRWTLHQLPARELWTALSQRTNFPARAIKKDEAPIELGRFRTGAIQATLRFSGDAIAEFRVFSDGAHFTAIGYHAPRRILYFDRRSSGSPDFHPNFAARHEAKITPSADGKLELALVIDRSTVEIFANQGAVYLPGVVFPPKSADAISLRAVTGEVHIESLATATPDSVPV